MPKKTPRTKRIRLRWLVALFTALLFVVSQTALADRDGDFRQGMTHYTRHQYHQARTCFEKAAQAGHTEAQTMLGVLYFQGNGVPQDDREAARWFEKAAMADEHDAQTFIGVMYLEGRGVPKNERKALAWFAKAAQWFALAARAGHPKALNQLGMAYLEGLGVLTDPAKAGEYFRQAAEKGNAHAQYNLAVFTLHHPDLLPGLSPAQIDATALAWFRKSAANGHPAAMEYLADVYRDGKLGQRPDPGIARQWADKAAAARRKQARTDTPLPLPQRQPLPAQADSPTPPAMSTPAPTAPDSAHDAASRTDTDTGTETAAQADTASAAAHDTGSATGTPPNSPTGLPSDPPTKTAPADTTDTHTGTPAATSDDSSLP